MRIITTKMDDPKDSYANRHITNDQATLQRLQHLAHLLDNAFKIPGINYTVGWDAIIGLVPGIGDAITVLPSGYIVYEAYRLGASKATLARMIANVILEVTVGSIPILGDIFDATWKANARNLYLLEQDLVRNSANQGNVAPGSSNSTSNNAPHTHGFAADQTMFSKPSNKSLSYLIGVLLVILVGGIALVLWVVSSLLSWIF
jgi:hypothetical protein